MENVETRNYMADYYKNYRGKTGEFFKKYEDTEEMDVVKAEIEKLTIKLRNASAKYAELGANRYNAELTPVTTNIIYKYNAEKNRWRGEDLHYFNGVTGTTVTSVNDSDVIIELSKKAGDLYEINGYSYPYGIVSVKFYKYVINPKNTKMSKTFVKETALNLIEGEIANSFSNGTIEVDHQGIILDSMKNYLDSYPATEFCKTMYGVDIENAFSIADLFKYSKINKSIEVVIKTSPLDCLNLLLDMKIDQAKPICDIIGISKAEYKEVLKTEGLLKYYLTLRKWLDTSITAYSYFPSASDTINKTPSEWIAFCKKCITWEEELNFYQIKYKDGIAQELIGYYAGCNPSYMRKEVFCKVYPFGKFCSYIVENIINQGFLQVRDYINQLSDYISICLGMNGKPNLYTGYLTLNHDIAARNHKIFLNEHQEEIFANRYKDDKDEKIKICGIDYWMIYPKKSEDIKLEGTNLCHCAASYTKSVLEGKTKLYFLRKKPDESLVTVEVNNGAIVQARGSHNRNLSEIEEQVLREYAKRHSLNYCI